ncbi:MAG: hypothetical protein DI601_03805 [Azospirillum brasilense]|nr:MAG: hypothetical protein DI601_03805 [Azospirillum brasilense]
MSAAELDAADFLKLHAVPASPSAWNLTTTIAALVTAWEADGAPREGRYRRRTSVQEDAFQNAIGAILGGALGAWAKGAPRAVFRSRKAQTFTGERVGRCVFLAAVDGMKALGLLHGADGIRFPGTVPGTFTGHASRWWPSTKLLRLAEARGIGPVEVSSAFVPEASVSLRRVVAPVILRPLGDGKGTDMALPLDDPKLAEIAADVKAHNAFAATVPVTGCDPPQWFRVFHHAPGHGWGLHGRWYTASSTLPYQTMKGGEKERCRTIRIGGEPVAEIDINASLLRVLYGLAGQTIPPGDPYAVEGLPREVVKAWIVQTLGSGKRRSRWCRKTTTPNVMGLHPAKHVRDAIEAHHPILRAPKTITENLNTASAVPAEDLVFGILTGAEAGVFTAAMRALREASPPVLTLPMHDGLMVPCSAVERAVVALARAWKRLLGPVPLRLSVARHGAGKECITL